MSSSSTASTVTESSPSTTPQIIIIKSGYTDSQARACLRYYQKNRLILCEKAKARYHKKKNERLSQTVQAVPEHQPTQEV